jgi:translation initiation factor 1
VKTPTDSCAELGVAKNKAMAKGGWQEFSRPESLQRGMPASDPTPKNQQRVRVQRTKAGKGGKMVTAITGLEAAESELKSLLKQLKAAAGTGGTVKDGVIELQGDQVAPALAALEKAGYKPKQAGG